VRRDLVEAGVLVRVDVVLLEEVLERAEDGRGGARRSAGGVRGDGGGSGRGAAAERGLPRAAEDARDLGARAARGTRG
jgi:hypothetical protein